MLESVPWYYILFWGIIGISVVVGFVIKVMLYSAAGGLMGFLIICRYIFIGRTNQAPHSWGFLFVKRMMGRFEND